MTRRLLALNGIAIFMIPLYHAAAYGLNAMFYWTDRYLAVAVPNFDQLGSFTYYALMISRELEKFAVPAFLFVSGFFVAFMARGNNFTISWDMVLPRVRALLVPFLLWSVFRFVILLRPPESVADFLQPYWFIVVLIQGYLLSPIIVPLARKRWQLLLAVTAALQVGAQMLRYLQFLGVSSPALTTLIDLTPMWFFPFQIMNFSIGVIAGVHLTEFKAWLTRWKWWILAAVVASALISMAEYQIVDHLTGPEWLGPQFNGLAGVLYSSLFTLAYAAFDELKLPFKKFWADLGTKSLGIYMANIPAIYIVAVFLYEVLPWTLGIQWIYVPVLAMAGLLIPLALMEIMNVPRIRWAYRYVFG